MAEPETTGPRTGAITRLLAGVGLLAIAATLFLAVLALVFGLGERREGPAQVAVKEKAAPALIVQKVQPIEGSGLVAITVGRGDNRGEGSYSRGPDPDRRNIVLLDPLTGVSRRLLPDNERRIDDVTFLPAAVEPEPKRDDPADSSDVVEAAGIQAPAKAPPPSMAYYVVAVHQKDGDRLDVLVGNLAGGAQGFLLTNIDGIDRMWMIAPTRLALLLREGMRLQYRVIDVPTLKTVAARPVDIG